MVTCPSVPQRDFITLSDLVKERNRLLNHNFSLFAIVGPACSEGPLLSYGILRRHAFSTSGILVVAQLAGVWQVPVGAMGSVDAEFLVDRLIHFPTLSRLHTSVTHASELECL